MKKDFTYQSINQRINQSVRYFRVPANVGKEAALNSLLDKVRESTPQKNKEFSLPVWTKAIAAVAAILILVFISGALISTQNVKNRGADVVTLRLPDHSRVVLAKESSVRFNKILWNRKVTLKGKAYFEVRHGSTFQVITNKGNVEVLGTRFMVDDKKGELQVICFEGKVKASFQDKEVILNPGSGIRFSNDKEHVKLAEREEYPGFARFSVNYSDTELSIVLKDLETFFGVKIDSKVQKARFFSGNLNTGNLETAVSIVTASLQLEYKIQGDQSILIY
jgi:transmembrane sensor